MLLISVCFHAWPTLKLFSLKLIEQVLVSFADHSYESFEIKFKPLLVKNKVNLVGPVDRTTRRIIVVCNYPCGDKKKKMHLKPRK